MEILIDYFVYVNSYWFRSFMFRIYWRYSYEYEYKIKKIDIIKCICFIFSFFVSRFKIKLLDICSFRYRFEYKEERVG